MHKQIEEKLHILTHLYESAQNKKILLEEMRIVADKAFQLQDELMQLLDEQEATETDIKAIQELFDIRETVWDTINKIALREMEIKEKTFSKETYQNKTAATKTPEHTCGCGHCHCHEEHTHDRAHEGTGKHCHCHEEHGHDCCHAHEHCCANVSTPNKTIH